MRQGQGKDGTEGKEGRKGKEAKRPLLRGTMVVLAAVIQACGGGGDDQPAPATQQAPAAVTTTAAPAPTPATPAGGAGQGQAVYVRTCATCHQQNGQGLAPAFPPLDATILAGDKTRLIRLVLHGMSGPITVQGRSYNNVMAPWKSLSDGDLAAVLTYVRQRFGNGAGPVTVEEVAAQRAATATRATMWTPRELGF